MTLKIKILILLSCLFPWMRAVADPVVTSLGSGSICPESEVVIPVTVSNCNGVAAISLVMNFDNTRLSYEGYQNLNSAVSSMLINQSGNTIYMTWANMSAVNVENGTLVELRFNSLNVSGNTTLSWNTSQCEYSDVTGTTLPANYYNGTVTVYYTPSISSNPVNRSITEGQGTNFEVGASGQGLTYQWQVKTPLDTEWNNLIADSHHSNVNSYRMYVNNAILDLDGNQYRCVVSGTCPSPVTSRAATLSVAQYIPTIVTSLGSVTTCFDQVFSIPVNVTNCNNVGAISLVLNYNSSLVTYAGYETPNPALENGYMRVNATDGKVYFTWASSNQALQLGNDQLISFAFKSEAGNSNLTWNTSQCEYTNLAGETLPASYNGSSLNIYFPPSITSNPTDQTVLEGASTTFTINASGNGLSYQWQMSQDQGISWETLSNGEHYSTVTNRTLHVNNVVYTMDGYRYRCLVNGTCDPSVVSEYATLHVETQMYNIHTTVGSLNTCSQNEFGIPISVTDCYHVGAISLALNYNPNVLTYTGYEGVNPALSGGQLQVNALNGTVFIAWASVDGAMVGNANLLTLNFTALTGSSSLSWNTEYCEYANIHGDPFPATYSNGNVYVAEMSYTITQQPANQTIIMEENATFSVMTEGSTSSFQWQYSQDQGSSWSNVVMDDHFSNPNTNSLIITNVPLEMNGYRFRCRIGGDCGYQFTTVATLTVNLPPNFYEITITSDPVEGGTTTGAGAHEENTQCTVTATPATGYDFVNWTENGEVVSTEASYTFLVTDHRDLVAHFTLQEISINVSSNPIGGGTINGGGTYLYGSHVLLTAIPITGSVFDNWTEDGEVISTNQSISFTAQTDRTLVANFSVQQINIVATPVPASNGSVEGAGVYAYGSMVTLVAHAEQGFELSNWTEGGVVVSTSDTLSFVAENDRNLQANFVIQSLHITASVDPEIGGTVSGAGTYNYGDPVVMTATPVGTSEFLQWTENGQFVSDEPTYVFNAFQDRHLVAHFNVSITIAATVNPEGSGEVSGTGVYIYNAPVTLTASPNAGFTFANWMESDTVYATTTSIIFTANANRNFVANFDMITYHVNVSSNSDEAGTVTGTGDYQEGTLVQVTAQPNEHYEFVNWTENGMAVSANPNYTFLIWNDRNLVGNFSLVSFDVTATANPEQGGTITGEGSYFYGSECTLTATPDPNFNFVNWMIGNEVVSTEPSYTFTVTQDVTAVANFECALALGEFGNMSPANDSTVNSVPVIFSWDAVSGATQYDLYMWPAGDPMPTTPYVSNLNSNSYSCNSLSNYQSYHWRVKAKNACNSSFSETLNFSVDVEPELIVDTTGINFGEVELNQSASTTLSVTGIMLDEVISFEITGEDASMFSCYTTWSWNNYSGGTLHLTFSPTVTKWTYNATLTISSGALTRSIALTGALENVYVFNTYVDGDVYPMNDTIPIHGTVTYFDNTPAPNLEVEIGITVMGWRRTLTAISDENGEFSVMFMPTNNESGYYTVNSGPVGNSSNEVHDSFDILGLTVMEYTLNDALQVTDYNWILCPVTENIWKTGNVLVRNRNSFDLHNISVEVLSAPANCNIEFTSMNLASMQDGYISYAAIGTPPTEGNEYQEVRLKATCAEGAEAIFTLWFYCEEARSELELSPNSINTTMTRGQSKTIDVMVGNYGDVATGEITINLPDEEWLSLVGEATLPSIEVGETTIFTLRLSPDNTVPLIQYAGNIEVACEHGWSAYLPYTVTAVSAANGILVVDATDEFTTNTNGGNGPHVEGAEVTLTGYYSLETVATGVTGADGTFTVENLPEGYYYLNVQANSHNGYSGVIYVQAGVTNVEEVFLQYQSVSYSWVVEPTEIQDEYEIVLDIEFDIEVPVPVITVSAPTCVSDVGDSTYVFNYVITNHGLVDAYAPAIYAAETEHFLFTPLYDHIDTIHGQQSIEVPCMITRKDSSPLDCGEWGQSRVQYSYLSGQDLVYNQAIAYTRLGSCTSCYTASISLPPINPGGGGGGGGGGTPVHPGVPGPAPTPGPTPLPVPEPPIILQPTIHVRVGVQFNQNLTMTREAFLGTFSVQNSHETNAIEGIGLDFVVRDEQGNDCTDLFYITTSSLDNLTAIDGTGTLGSQSSGTAQILFVPTREAAPTEPKMYYFGGTFTFVDPWNSATRVVELFPTELEVHPSPDLYIDYFVSHIVHGDDLRTPYIIEPVIPAELAVMVWNRGAGTAKNVVLESAQPVIVSNAQNLIVDFNLIGTYMQGVGVQLGVNSIDFGNIGSGESRVGEWLFTCPYRATVVSYDAHVIHSGSLAGTNLSLVSHVGIHELTHAIYTGGPLGRSGEINDFLVNDIPDEHNYPDSIFFSDGRRTSVDVVSNIGFDHYVGANGANDTIVTLTLTPSRVGWNYGETEDPGLTHFELVSCTRNNDNVEIPMSNVWQEPMLEISSTNDSTYVNRLRIVDTLSTAAEDFTYTLVYNLKQDLLDVVEITGIPEVNINDPLESFNVRFNKSIVDTTFTYEDMILRRDNGDNLMDSSIEITRVNDSLFSVNISSLTTEMGSYVLIVNTLDIVDYKGYTGYNGRQAAWIQSPAHEQQSQLAQGWNWWSTPVEQNGIDGLTMLENSLGQYGLTIKTQNEHVTNYYSTMGYDYWYGSLDNLQNEKCYLINTTVGCTATMTGVLATPEDHPITIVPNWNWNGYPVSVQQTVVNAFSGFTPSANDVVKHQSDFSTYYPTYGWWPEDFMMIPGRGYLYKSNATENKTLVYANTVREAAEPQQEQQHYWSTDVHAYPNNFNVIAVVAVDGKEQRSDKLELGAFVNGECRGSARLRYFAPLDRYYAMLTVTGEAEEHVEFALVDTESEETMTNCDNLLTFARDVVIGLLDEPYVVGFNTAKEEPGRKAMALYPNPVNRNQVFSLNIPATETITEIIIVDMMGDIVRHETGALDAQVVRGFPVTGVYVVKAVAKSGNVYYGRIIVK